MNDHILELKNVTISFSSNDQKHIAVNNLSFSLKENEILGIVGESGSGKSVSTLSITGLIPSADKEGQVIYDKRNITHHTDTELRPIRGKEIAMIFQDPMTSLNPTMKCGHQVDEMLALHTTLSAEERKHKVIELFNDVMLPHPERIYDAYPHELSGGQLQRVMIAMAISCNPKVLIADEPTTALDVTVQKEILRLLKSIQEKYKNAIIFITHDLGVVHKFTDRIIVMNKGEIVEEGLTTEVFAHPKHPYTKGLLACRPPISHRLKRLPTVQDFLLGNKIDLRREEAKINTREKILTVENLSKHYQNGNHIVKAVNNVSFDIRKGETLGIVGESGCGKSTLSKVLMRLIPATSGKVLFDGKDLFSLRKQEMSALRKDFQIIFQDPYSSLNPRLTIGHSITEPMKMHGLHSPKGRKEKVISLLEKVGLSADQYDRYPHEFSGGQRQRICIARTLGLEPKFIICDESVSALDVSVQAQVLNLLKELKEEHDLSYIFISHDLSVVNFIADRILVMKSGEILERGMTEDIIQHPQHGYTKNLVDSIHTI